MTIAWVVSSSSSFLRHHLHHVFLHESYSTVTAILFILVFHTILSILFVHVCPRCPAPCAVDLCLWAQITWRFSSSCVGWFPGVGMHPSAELAGPSGSNRALAKRIVAPGGPFQYCAVHQYSVVRRVWGASGVAGFLIFAPPTPPQDLVAGILSTHVRCSLLAYLVATASYQVPQCPQQGAHSQRCAAIGPSLYPVR